MIFKKNRHNQLKYLNIPTLKTRQLNRSWLLGTSTKSIVSFVDQTKEL